ncbi:RNI-like protein, partial [Eremomyces bilateralis CBS 781.70]
NMVRIPRPRRFSTGATSDTSSSTSPERGADDDNDSIMINPNDSISSLAASVEHDRDADMEDRRPLAPIEALPAELMIAIFARLSSSPQDLRSCMLVSRDWARNSVALLWHRPQTNNWKSLQTVVRTISNKSTFDYPQLVRRLNLSTLNNQVSDGTLMAFRECKRIERLTLTNCTRLSDQSVKPMIVGNRSLLALDVTGLEGISSDTMLEVAKNCYRLQGLNITNCRLVTDEGLEAIARSCRHIKRLKFNGCNQITSKAVLEFAAAAQYLLEIDLHCVHLLEDDAVTALLSNGNQLRELRLSHCSRITDAAFLNLPTNAQYESLRILDLTDCIELQDAGVQRIVTAAPRLRNLVLAKCRQLTDRAVIAITRLGKNLHYIHLGHCARITDAGVLQLVKLCNRIRYIDLACCSQLTDQSVHMLATLPKLKRIGLVKCDNITDRSIYALAKPRNAGNAPNIPPLYAQANFIPGYNTQNAMSGATPSSLERVHLSYCRNLTLNGIHALLNNCPRLTHLSLTGVQAFLRDDLLRFCRAAPPEFNEHQRNLFCVFSGHGVKDLRTFLN